MLAQVLQRVIKGDYKIPAGVAISQNCRDLLARILVTDPSRRICIKEIQQHPWCAGLLFALPSWASIALP